MPGEDVKQEFDSIHDLSGWTIHGYAVCIMGDPNGERNIERAEGRPIRA